MKIETTSAKPSSTTIAPILSAITALVGSLENATSMSPAATAFSKAIRRKGEELILAGGPAALVHALSFIRSQALAKADHREVILDKAWAGLPGWRP